MINDRITPNKAAFLDKKSVARKDQAAKTRLNIFNVARDLLAERPFENITIQDIVSRAGVSVGTFYLYFGAKQDVFFEAHTESDQYFIKHVKPAVKTKSTAECLDIFFYAYADRIVSVIGKRMVRLMFSPSNTAFSRRGPNTLPGILQAIIKKGVKEETISADLPVDEIVDFYLAMARGMMYDWSAKDEEYDLPERMVKFGRKIFQSIRA